MNCFVLIRILIPNIEGNGEDVRKVRRTLHQYGNTGIKIISKIERPVALKNLDDIIKESDGVMVARGNLV